MNRPLKPSEEIAVPKPERYPAISTIVKSLLATGVLLGFIVGGVCFTGKCRLPFAQYGDELTQKQIADRAAAFNALGPIHLVRVPEKEVPAAIESMLLSADAKRLLEADLAGQPYSDNIQEASPKGAPPLSGESRPSAHSSTSPQNVPADWAASRLGTGEGKHFEENRLSLAWISLWDTDAEDGDMVRIDSQGYSRTVLLKKRPVTLAVPVPADGIIKVTGIRDGEGGGITVGLASGTSEAVFPVMSEGQVLNLRVNLD
jgi:hypothetical protein